MSRFAKKKQRRTFEITGLIDVVFILLVFFMVIIVPGSGGGDADDSKLDLPQMKGMKPQENLTTLTFRIENDGKWSKKSKASPNVLYCLIPYQKNDVQRKGIKFNEAYETARTDSTRFRILYKIADSGPARGVFIGDTQDVKLFIENSIKDYNRDHGGSMTGVLISAIQDTPFGLINFIFDACTGAGVVDIEFRTAE